MTMAKPDAVFLDHNGIVTDREWPWYLGWKEVLTRCGYDLSVADWIRLDGNHRPDALLRQLIGRATTRCDWDTAIAVAWSHPVELREGVDQLLGHLHEHDVPTYMVTTSSSDWLRRTLPWSASQYFRFVRFPQGSEPGKPHPHLYATMLQSFGLSPGRSVAIEDCPRGLQSPRALGMPVIYAPSRVYESVRIDNVPTVSSLSSLSVNALGRAMAATTGLGL